MIFNKSFAFDAFSSHLRGNKTKRTNKGKQVKNFIYDFGGYCIFIISYNRPISEGWCSFMEKPHIHKPSE